MSYFATGYQGRSAAEIRRTKRSTHYKDSDERVYVFALPKLAQSASAESPTFSSVCMEVVLPTTHRGSTQDEIWFPSPSEEIHIIHAAPEADPARAQFPSMIVLHILSIDYRHGRRVATLIGIVDLCHESISEHDRTLTNRLLKRHSLETYAEDFSM